MNFLKWLHECLALEKMLIKDGITVIGIRQELNEKKAKRKLFRSYLLVRYTPSIFAIVAKLFIQSEVLFTENWRAICLKLTH